jgi:predicted transposase/invertase (TIGR01784 family)
MKKAALGPKEVWYDLLNDVMFKIVFGSEGNEELLRYLLNALLEYEGDNAIVSLNILNPFLIPSRVVEKLGILDILAKDASGKLFSIEMQREDDDDLINRALFYADKKFATQLKAGESYGSLRKTLALWILGPNVEPLASPAIHNSYGIKHLDNNELLTDIKEYHFVELSKFHDKNHKKKTSFHNWLYLLKHSHKIRSIEDLPKSIKNEKGIKEVVTKMLEANTNDRLIHYIHSREMAILDEIAKEERIRKLKENTKKLKENTKKLKENTKKLKESAKKQAIKSKQEGKQEEARAIVLHMLGQGIEIATIAKLTNISLENVKNIVDSVTN